MSRSLVSASLRSLASAVLLSLTVVGAAQAYPLNLIKGEPDLQVALANVAYQASTDTLTVSSVFAGENLGDFTFDSSTGQAITWPAGSHSFSYILTAQVGEDGELLPAAGSLSFTVDGDSYLSGNVFSFGHQASQDSGFTVATFEFLLAGVSDAMPEGFPRLAGVIVHTRLNGADAQHLFASDFSNLNQETNTTVDTFAAPEPGTLSLMALAAVGLGARARRRRV